MEENEIVEMWFYTSNNMFSIKKYKIDAEEILKTLNGETCLCLYDNHTHKTYKINMRNIAFIEIKEQTF